MCRELKHIIIIPSLNPNQRLISLVDELIDTKICRIVIVNDGSDMTCSSIFERLNNYKDVVVLNHKTNLGRGAALKTAFSYCIGNFKDCFGVVTATDDGQYKASEIIKVAQESERFQSCLILGERPLDETNTSKIDYIGNKALRQAFRFLYDLKMSDPRTELRAIPMSELSWILKIKGQRYEYEVNMLIQAKRRNVKIKQIPIKISSFNLSEKSHYKTISDTTRIVMIFLLNICLYSAASVLSIVIDVGTFFICNTFIFSKVDVAFRLFMSTVISRTLSSMWDFSINRKFFTKGVGEFKTHLVRYYTLWFCQMMTSYFLLYMLHSVIKINASILKGMVDIFLAIISYKIQLRYVFSNTKPEENFYGELFYFSRWLLKFSIKRLEVVGEIPSGRTVFIGHHQNLRGALSIMTWFEKPLRLWMLDVFCEKESCFRQYYEYTLTKRLGYSKPIAYIASHIFSVYVSNLARSMRAIPVARSTIKVLELTIIPSVEALEKNEKILLFPDIDYDSESENMGKLYTGFMNIEKYYFARNNEHVNFVPIKVNALKRQICIGQSSFVKEGETFIQAKKRIPVEIIQNFNLL